MSSAKGNISPVLFWNWIDGHERACQADEVFSKVNPANGKLLCEVA